MTYEKALSIIEVCIAQHQAFLELKEVAELLVGKEQRLHELTAKLANLDAQLEERHEVARQLESCINELNFTLGARQLASQEELSQLAATHQVMREKQAEVEAELTAKFVDLGRRLQMEYQTNIDAYHKDMSILRDRTREAQSVKDQLDQQISEIKSRITGL